MASGRERQPISEKEAARIKNHAERVVVTTCLTAGYQITDSPSIRLDRPITTSDGSQKTVHHPDRLLVNPDNPNESYYLEVSNGNGNTPHKHEQEEVVKRAGINNHIVVTADIWRYLEDHANDPDAIREVWRHITGW